MCYLWLLITTDLCIHFHGHLATLICHPLVTAARLKYSVRLSLRSAYRTYSFENSAIIANKLEALLLPTGPTFAMLKKIA